MFPLFLGGIEDSSLRSKFIVTIRDSCLSVIEIVRPLVIKFERTKKNVAKAWLNMSVVRAHRKIALRMSHDRDSSEDLCFPLFAIFARKYFDSNVPLIHIT